MFKSLIKLRKQQVFYILHRFKNKKIKHKHKKNKCSIQTTTTTNHNVNNYNNNNIDKYYNLLTTKPKTTTNETVKMLNINFLHDHIRDVIYKIRNRNCYHHHHYDDDLFCTCNLMPNKRKRRRRTKTKTIKTQNNQHFYSENSFSSCFPPSCSYTSSCSAKCYCESLKIRSKFSDYIRHVRVYFQKTFKNLQLIIVIFLLALITTTANSIQIQEKTPQRNSTSLTLSSASSPSSSATAAEALASAALLTSNTSESVYMPCADIPNALLNQNGANNSVNFKENICNKLRHFHHQRHRRRALKNLAKFRRNQQNKMWFKSYRKKLQNLNKQIHNLHHNRYYKLNHQRDEDKLGNSSYFKTTNKTKVQSKLTDLSIKKQINIQQQQPHNDILPVNMHINSEDEEDNDDDDDDINDNKNSDHDEAEINKSHFFTVDLLPPATTTKTLDNQQTIVEKPLSSIYDHHQHHHQYSSHQEIDNYHLMKLVMTGLGLKKLPNMKTVNISQQEYATKYQEYLQLVHTRKRRELRDEPSSFYNDEAYSLKPLQILSIVSNNTIINDYYDEVQTKRQKREMIEIGSHVDKDSDDTEMEAIAKQMQNILFVRKKHQKPRSTKKQKGERKTNIRLMFALKPEALNLSSDDIEEANIRLVLIHSPTLAIRNHKNKKKHANHKNNSCRSSKVDGGAEDRSSSVSPPHIQVNVLNLKLFLMNNSGKRTWLDGRKVDIHVDLSKPDETHTQWLQFDVTKAVKATIEDGRLQHVALELQCENCKRVGARILNDAHNTASDAQADDPTTEGYQLMPVLNIIGRFAQNQHTLRPHKHESIVKPNSKDEATTQRIYHHHQVYNNDDKNHQRHNNRRTNCYKTNQRCCRHAMEVTFKEIKGFEFIIQPKVFDAGYCHGRCPPRYNPAHHHAMLQSLIWKQNHQKAPRPCCAPSKLAELEVLHVDEKDSEKLKISTWSDMKVVECACS